MGEGWIYQRDGDAACTGIESVFDLPAGAVAGAGGGDPDEGADGTIGSGMLDGGDGGGDVWDEGDEAVLAAREVGAGEGDGACIDGAGEGHSDAECGGVGFECAEKRVGGH
jgi:hypothetical protein